MSRTVPLLLLAALVLVAAVWCGRGERSSRTVSTAPAPTVTSSSASGSPLTTPLFTTPTASEAPRAPLAVEQVSPTKKLALRVLTLDSLGQDAERVGSLAFQILAQRPTARKVRNAGQFSLFSLPLDANDAPLFEGRTDASGEATIELSAGSPLFGQEDSARVCGRVVEPGYQQRVCFASVPEDGGPCELRILAARGATVRGRVVDATGNPVSAEVRLGRWIAPEGERRLDSAAQALRLAEGGFELHLMEHVADGLLLADAGEAGTGSLAVELTLEAPPQDLEIVVQGRGALHGRVLDGSGAPASGVELFVVLAELDDDTGSSVMPEPARSLRESEGGGLLWGQMQTGSDGSFELRGLRVAPYVVRARTRAEPYSGYPLLLTPTPVLAQDEELVLRLARPHLVIQLRDAVGAAWTPTLDLRRPETSFSRPPHEWPATANVMVFPCTPIGVDPCATGDALVGKSSALGEAVYEVRDDARYLVGAMGAGFDGSLRVVEVPPGASRVPVELRARSAELGAVSVRVVHAGAELTGDRSEDFDVRLVSVDTGATLLARQLYGAQAPFFFRAPAGTYRVVAEGTPYVDSHHGVLMRPRKLGRGDARVELVPGAAQELVLELDDGARLEVSLAGEATEADRAAVVAEYDWLKGPEHEERLANWAASAELRLLRSGLPPEEVCFSQNAFMETSAAGLHLAHRWPCGETHLSEILPTGSFTLVARLPGGREARAEVELVSGTATKVSLGF